MGKIIPFQGCLILSPIYKSSFASISFIRGIEVGETIQFHVLSINFDQSLNVELDTKDLSLVSNLLLYFSLDFWI